MNITEKENIKNQIDSFCNGISIKSYSGYVSAPTVILVYLGKKTYDQVNAFIKNAFTTSFSLEPGVYDMIITPSITKDEIIASFESYLREAYKKSREIDARVAFISMMDNDLFNDKDYLTKEIKDAFEELDNEGLSFHKIAFYGLFEGKKAKQPYSKAYDFINTGKDIWRNIYHMDIPSLRQDCSFESQVIALNIIRDDYSMIQTPGDEYSWSSLYLHYLKIAEVVVCRILKAIYDKQIDGKNMNVNDWNKSVNDILDQYLDEEIHVEDNECYLYVPLTYQQVQEPKQSKGFFKRKKENVVPTFNNVLRDENSINELVHQLYDGVELNTDVYNQIIEKIITSSNSLDPNTTLIGQEIIRILNSRLSHIENNKNQLINKYRSHNNIQNIKQYLYSEYTYFSDIYSKDKEKDIINNMIKIISNENSLKKVIEDIIDKNHQYSTILDELTLGEYGGTQEDIGDATIPEFKVNQSVEEILDNIDINFVREKISNKQSIIERLKGFISHTVIHSINDKHNLGMINANYTSIQPVEPHLLITSQFSYENDVTSLIQRLPNLKLDENDIYKDTSFFIISTRNYSSQNYIVRYRREGK